MVRSVARAVDRSDHGWKASQRASWAPSSRHATPKIGAEDAPATTCDKADSPRCQGRWCDRGAVRCGLIFSFGHKRMELLAVTSHPSVSQPIDGSVCIGLGSLAELGYLHKVLSRDEVYPVYPGPWLITFAENILFSHGMSRTHHGQL